MLVQYIFTAVTPHFPEYARTNVHSTCYYARNTHHVQAFLFFLLNFFWSGLRDYRLRHGAQPTLRALLAQSSPFSFGCTAPYSELFFVV